MSLRWAVGETRAQLDRIRGGWEGRLLSCFGREGKTLQVEAKEARVLMRQYADVIASMQGCYRTMQERSAGCLQSAKAQQQLMAATIYACVRLVRCTVSSCGEATC